MLVTMNMIRLNMGKTPVKSHTHECINATIVLSVHMVINSVNVKAANHGQC